MRVPAWNGGEDVRFRARMRVTKGYDFSIGLANDDYSPLLQPVA